MAVGARGLYNSRNRWLHVELGRFLTRDPAEAAMPIITALAFNGDTLDGLAAGTATLPFSPTGHYADGFNLYQFAGSNPVNRSDPLGLEWGMEDDIDYLIAEQEGHRLYALATLNEGAKWAALGLNTALDIASSLLGLDVFESIYLLGSGKGGFWEAMNIVCAVNPVGKLGMVGGKVAHGLALAKKAGRAGKLVAEGLEHLFKIGKYRDMAKLTRGKGGDIMAHHILEARHARNWELPVNTDDLPAVILSRELHEKITGALFSKLPTGRKHSREEVRAVYQKVYGDLGFAEWLQHIERYFR